MKEMASKLHRGHSVLMPLLGFDSNKQYKTEPVVESNVIECANWSAARV